MTAPPPSSRAGPGHGAFPSAAAQVSGGLDAPEAGHALPDSPQSPALARGLLRSALEGFPAETVDTALVLVSELVANAVLHTESPLVLQIDAALPHVRVSVEDSSADQPQPQEMDVEAVSGRGLWLVDAMSASWGWQATAAGGKRVWFELEP